jgi:hypothetical protein
MALSAAHIMQSEKQVNALTPGVWKDTIMASFKLIFRGGLT